MDMDNDLPGCWAMWGVTLVTLALLLTLGGNFWCDFASRVVTVSLPDREELGTHDATVSMGIWSYVDYQTFVSTDGTYLYVTTYGFCVPYGDNIKMDALWNAAMAFSVIAAVVGGLVSIFSCCVICVSPAPRSISLLAIGCLLTTLFQGLVFLYFPSAGCQSGPDTVTTQSLTVNAVWHPCTPTNAGNMAISAVVFWFLSFLVMGYVAKKVNDEEETEIVITEAPASAEPLIPDDGEST